MYFFKYFDDYLQFSFLFFTIFDLYTLILHILSTFPRLQSLVTFAFGSKYVAIAPLVIAPVIIHKIGLAHFSKLSFDPTVFHTSHWALDKGLFSAVAKDENELEAIFNQKIQFLSELNPEGLSALKSTIWKETEHFDEEMLNRAAESLRF